MKKTPARGSGRAPAGPRVRLDPDELRFMLPTLVERLPKGPEWLFEIKWDGVRVLALRVGGEVELWSRNRLTVARQYPEVATAIGRLPGGDLALDAEVVALDAHGRSSFQRLQRRMHVTGDLRRLAREVPVTAYVYDCLAFSGRDARHLPLVERKTLVRELVAGGDVLRYCDHVEAKDGQALFEAACEAGLEGVVAKRVDAPYVGGRRREWQKIKSHRRQEFVIGGWTDPQGTRGHLGALHLGVYDGDELVYVGRAGSGLGDAVLRDLSARLRALATERSPFAHNTPRGRGHHWVCPELVCEVRFTDWTDDGSIRHPVFLGLRPDKRARDVRREIPK
jgi:DNA ligase D-like protein (predicted ligase)